MTVTRDARSVGARSGEELAPVAVLPIVGLVALKLALQCTFLTGYGWHRDEFYYLVGGRHLDVGYVDHPLLTPWVARGVDMVFGPSLTGLRLVPALLGAVVVVVTALLAREFGGDRRAQIVAALLVVLSPLFLATNHLFQTVTFDQVAWVLTAFALVRLIRTGDQRWWLAVGAAVAVGCLAKSNIGIWVAGLLLGLLLTPERRLLRSRWCAIGAAIAFLGALPFLWFQLRHGWPFPEFVRVVNDETAGEERPKFIPAQLLQSGPVAAFVWIPGLVALFRDRWLRPYRALGWAFAIAFGFFLVSGAKSYYLGGAYPVLFAAGAAVLARRWHRLPRLLITGMALSTLLVLPAMLPILPAPSFADSPYGAMNDDALEEVGWARFVEQVRRVVEAQPRRTMVITSNYGEAGALEVLGDLDVPVRSPQNSYWFWGRHPSPRADTTFVLVGFGPRERRATFHQCRVVSHVDNRIDVDNDEQRAPIAVCSGTRGRWEDAWTRLQRFG